MNAGRIREILGWARYYLNLEWHEIDEVLEKQEGSAKSWYSQKSCAGPQDFENLRKLDTIRIITGRIFGGNSSAAREWFNEELAILEDRSPITIMKGEDMDFVIKILAGISTGAYF